MSLLLVHGWGFDASFWDPLRAHLEDVETVAWDLGFRGSAAFPPPPAGKAVLAVGHSFGLLWLLHERPLAWRSLVSINGFPKFAAADDFPAGVAPRLIERMIARFAETPEKVYDDFMRRSGVAAPATAGLDARALADGLAALRDWDGRGGAAVDAVLAGRADPIVTPTMTEAAFAGLPARWHDGGHLLPMEAPEWCARHLRRLHERLDGAETAIVAPDFED